MNSYCFSIYAVL